MAPTVAVVEVSGMSCSHCVGAVRAAVVEVPGVSAAEVDLDAATVRVVGESFDLAAVREAIEEAGYTASAAPGGGAAEA